MLAWFCLAQLVVQTLTWSTSAAIALFGAVEWTSSDMRKRTRIMSELGQGLEYRCG